MTGGKLEVEAKNSDDEPVIFEVVSSQVTPVQLESVPLPAVREELRVLVSTHDDSLGLWQAGRLYRLPDTAGVFAAVFVGDAEHIAYVREHEVWCLDMHTQMARQVPLPPELAASIPYDHEAPNNIFWLAGIGNSSQVVATVFQATSAYGTILVDCNAHTSRLIDSTNPGRPVVAPDGSKIAIVGSEAVSVFDMDSAVTKVLLTFEPISTYTSASFYPILSWSATAGHILTVIHPQDWWVEDVDEPSIVYRLDIEKGEVEAIAEISRMFVREPHTAVAFAGEKLVYSIPVDPLTPPFGIIPTRQMILDINIGQETLLFEATAGFSGWNPLGSPTDFSGWNPTGNRLSFWEGDEPNDTLIGVYDLSAGHRLEQRLPGTFAGWISDTSFLYTVDGTLHQASLVELEITSLELAANIDRVYQARIFK